MTKHQLLSYKTGFNPPVPREAHLLPNFKKKQFHLQQK